MIPKSIEFVCKNCNTNIDNNWWWCKICGNDVVLLEIKHYSTLQKAILKAQKLFTCIF